MEKQAVELERQQRLYEEEHQRSLKARQESNMRTAQARQELSRQLEEERRQAESAEVCSHAPCLRRHSFPKGTRMTPIRARVRPENESSA